MPQTEATPLPKDFDYWELAQPSDLIGRMIVGMYTSANGEVRFVMADGTSFMLRGKLFKPAKYRGE